MAAHQAPPSLEFSGLEHWSGLPFPSPMHESEKWKWSGSVVSNSSQPHGLQPTRLLCPWDFPGKSTGVGCHCLLRYHCYRVLNTWTLHMKSELVIYLCCCSVTKLCPTLCDPMDGSRPGFSVLHYLPEFFQAHVHWFSVALQPSHSLPPPSSPALSLTSIRVFASESLFMSGSRRIGASASASVFPVNIRGWFPLRLTGLNFLLSERLSRVFSNITVKKH